MTGRRGLVLGIGIVLIGVGILNALAGSALGLILLFGGFVFTALGIDRA